LIGERRFIMRASQTNRDKGVTRESLTQAIDRANEHSRQMGMLLEGETALDKRLKRLQHGVIVMATPTVPEKPEGPAAANER
jgi:hypothetical protein